jgi:GT2 family glycosyltransferase
MESLFLYADDAELTLRFTREGGVIRLVPEAVVSDRYPSWNATASRGGNLARRTLHMDDSKAYYEARNRNYLSRRFYPGRGAAYAINKAIFLGSLYLIAILNARLGRARLIHRALNDGEAMATRQGAPVSANSER